MPTTLVINPQLCKTFDPKKHKIKPGMWMEPKLDGARAIVVVDDDRNIQVFSRTGKPFWNHEYIQAEIKKLPFANYVLDGEFFYKDWNTTLHIIRKESPDPLAEKLKFYTWDLIFLDAWVNGRDNRPQKERSDFLQNVLYGDDRCTEKIEMVGQEPVSTLEDVYKAFEDFQLAGWEGGVLKDPDDQYVLGKRSAGWLKLKPWITLDLPIVEAIKGEPGKYENTLGMLIVEGDCEVNNKTEHIRTGVGSFAVKDAERNRLWALHQAGSLVGKIAEIKIQHMTVESAGRHGIFYRLREDR
jgi:ATP-dependent DNA ligase